MSTQSYGGRSIVASGLNLWLPLRDPDKMPELLFNLQKLRALLDARLSELAHVHYARFVPAPIVLPNSAPPSSGGRAVALQVITEYDGDFDAYVMDFAMTIKEGFNLILSYVDGWPVDPATQKPQLVENIPAFFLEFIRQRDLGYFNLGQGPIRVFSAYPQKTVIDITGVGGIAPAANSPAPEAVDRADVQANVLRGVNARHAWHWSLRVADRAAAGAFLASLLPGGSAGIKLSNDADWQAGTRPDYWLTLGLSYCGLRALGMQDADDQAFQFAHGEFVRGPGAYATSRSLGDVGDSDPATWQLGGDRPLDLMLSLYADDESVLNDKITGLQAAALAGGLAEAVAPWRACHLPRDEKGGDTRATVHFGYVDDLAQPRLAIASGDPGGQPSLAPDARVGEFLLGRDYKNVYGGTGTLGGLSPALAQNATFAAVRIMEQDVAAFEKLLDDAAALHPHPRGREWIAAKLMGRWRDGTPISLSPDKEDPQASSSNAFDYRKSDSHMEPVDDSAGTRCPMGAHARRMNPRSARVAGLAHSRRLIRRGMPYGPAWDGKDVETPRGLFGVFHCADLKRQYEFILREWAQGDTSTSGITGQQDPIIGAQCTVRPGREMKATFTIPMEGGDTITLEKVPRLVTTVGSVYLFMPGLAGLAHVAARAQSGAQTATPSTEPCVRPGPAQIDPATFDPRDPVFRRDPFPAYAWFRANKPVVELPRMDNSVWVFDYATVLQIALDGTNYHKRLGGFLDVPKGLLTMDKPGHTGLRAVMQADFDKALSDATPEILQLVQALYAEKCRGKGELDLVSAFIAPLSERIIFSLMGVAPEGRPGLVALVRQILASATPTDETASRIAIKRLQARCVEELTEQVFTGRASKTGLLAKCMAIHNAGQPFDPVSNQPTNGATALAVEQITNVITLLMSGIVPLQGFLALAVWRLLDNKGEHLRTLRNNAGISNNAVVSELLRYDMPTPLSNRFTMAPVTLGGLSIPAGKRIVLCWPSANRDSAQFPQGDTLDFARHPQGPGLAFGAPSDRYCLGAGLVYTVGEAVVQLLRTSDPVPVLQPGAAPAFISGAMFRLMAELPVDC